MLFLVKKFLYGKKKTLIFLEGHGEKGEKKWWQYNGEINESVWQ